MGFLSDTTKSAVGALNQFEIPLIDAAVGGVTDVSEALDNLATFVDGALVLANPRQKETEWEFILEREYPTSLQSINMNLNPLEAVELIDLKYKVRSISFPQLKLITQRTKWGTNPFIGFDHPELVNMMIEEDIFFQTRNYFQNWLDGMFDQETNTFIAGEDSSHIYRTGYLTMGKSVPILRMGGLDLKFSKLKFLGFEPMTVVYDGDDCIVYNLTFAVETIREVGETAASVTSNILKF